MTQSQTLPSHAVTLDDVVTTVIMARVTDYFGFFVYAIASVLVFPSLFFPTLSPVSGTLLSFLIFSLAFIARPIASLAGRRIQQSIGRAGKITLALMILGTSTVAIGLLPGYETLGWQAPALLALLRFAQGLGLGGAWDGITLQLKSAAPAERDGLYSMIPQLGAPIGFCVAASMFYVFTGFLTETEFLTYGWRFAFFAVMAVNVVSLFARIRLLTTDFGGDDTPLKSAPLSKLFQEHGRTILLSTFLPLASYALLHMVTVFPLSYELLFGNQDITHILLLELIGGAICIGTVMLSGYLTDKYSRRQVLWASTALIPILCLTIYSLQTTPAVYILLGFALLGLAYGQSSSIVPKRFSPEFRYSGSAMSTNLTWIIGAAFAPLTALGMTALFGLWAAALYLLSGVAASMIALYLLQQQENAEQ